LDVRVVARCLRHRLLPPLILYNAEWLGGRLVSAPSRGGRRPRCDAGRVSRSGIAREIVPGWERGPGRVGFGLRGVTSPERRFAYMVDCRRGGAGLQLFFGAAGRPLPRPPPTPPLRAGNRRVPARRERGD